MSAFRVLRWLNFVPCQYNTHIRVTLLLLFEDIRAIIIDMGRTPGAKPPSPAKITRAFDIYTSKQELTLDESAKKMGVSGSTLRRWAKMDPRYPNWEAKASEGQV